MTKGREKQAEALGGLTEGCNCGQECQENLCSSGQGSNPTNYFSMSLYAVFAGSVTKFDVFEQF